MLLMLRFEWEQRLLTKEGGNAIVSLDEQLECVASDLSLGIG